MKYNFVFGDDGRAVVMAAESHPQPGGVTLEAPEGFFLHRAEDWVYDGGTWAYNPLPPEEEREPEEYRSPAERVAELEEALELLLSGVTE